MSTVIPLLASESEPLLGRLHGVAINVRNILAAYSRDELLKIVVPYVGRAVLNASAKKSTFARVLFALIESGRATLPISATSGTYLPQYPPPRYTESSEPRNREIEHIAVTVDEDLEYCHHDCSTGIGDSCDDIGLCKEFRPESRVDVSTVLAVASHPHCLGFHSAWSDSKEDIEARSASDCDDNLAMTWDSVSSNDGLSSSRTVPPAMPLATVIRSVNVAPLSRRRVLADTTVAPQHDDDAHYIDSDDVDVCLTESDTSSSGSSSSGSGSCHTQRVPAAVGSLIPLPPPLVPIKLIRPVVPSAVRVNPRSSKVGRRGASPAWSDKRPRTGTLATAKTADATTQTSPTSCKCLTL